MYFLKLLIKENILKFSRKPSQQSIAFVKHCSDIKLYLNYLKVTITILYRYQKRIINPI